MELTAEDAARIGALADDTRRALYRYVIEQAEPISRDQAAAALGLARHNVSFHLDRLVEEGLLEVEYRRLSGRAGPGAGRPNKLYRRAPREVMVSLPGRRYDLAGDILATAILGAQAGVGLEEALRQSAHGAGTALAAEVTGATDIDSLAAVAQVLASRSFEPRLADGVLEFANCPFAALAEKHTELVCGLNLLYVQGVVDGLGRSDVRATLEAGPGRCCVRVHAPG